MELLNNPFVAGINVAGLIRGGEPRAHDWLGVTNEL
jgi:hypothetical protein